MITTNIVYDHRARTKPGNEGPLEVRITIGRKRYYIGTGIHVRKSEWKQGLIVNRPNAEALNARLNTIWRKIENEVTAAVNDGRQIDVADIRKRVWTVQADETAANMLEWISEQIDSLTLADGTLKHYRTLLTRLYEFDTIRRWSDLTAENICKFDAWLHKLTKPQSDAEIKAKKPKEPLSDGAIYNYHKCLKALINRAIRFERITENPYERLRGQFKSGDRERVDFLTDEEMQAFMSLKPVAGSKMAMARDIFVFQMFTGLAYTDAQHFDISEYKRIKGVWRNQGERIKTGVAYTSQLLPPVVEVLEKYGMQVPKMDNADYNRCLKLLGEAAGIERPLHSHMARHTFATYMLRNGVPIEHVSKMVGHTNITQTQRYAKIVAADIHSDFDKISKKLKPKK